MKPGVKLLHLLYHEIVPGSRPYAYATTLEQFSGHLALFRQLEHDGAAWQPGITFDDGHRSLYEYGLPELAHSGLSAQLFITAGWIGQRAQYLSWPELRSLQQAGHSIGAHGWSHALLTRCSDAQLQMELGDSRKLLEDGLGTAVTTLSFPGGRYDRRVLAACRAAGYRRFFTSSPQVATQPLGELTGRVNIRQSMDPAWMRTLFTPGGATLRRLRLEEGLKATLKRLLGDDRYGRLWSRLNHEPPQMEEAG